MARFMYLPEGGVVISTRDAQDIAQTIFAAQDLAGRHGARLKPNVILIAAELSSIHGTTEVTHLAIEHSVEYEQITANTAADILGCSPRNVTDLATRGKLPGIKKSGRWLFNKDDIIVYRDYR